MQCSRISHYRTAEYYLRFTQHVSVETGHEIISTAVLSLPLIQVGQLPVTGERMTVHVVLVIRLGSLQEQGGSLSYASSDLRTDLSFFAL